MDFTDSLPSDPTATALLNAYFDSRELGFAGAQGYRIVFPGDEQFTPPHGVFLVARKDGDALGCGGIRMIAPGEDGAVRFEVKHLWVDPAARGAGVGRRLLAELERRAIGFGAAETVLDTNASLKAAAGLYHSSGYRSIPPYNDNPNATNWYSKRL
ncbi:MAG TPA: GNAT family N-acetyltransferase [Terrimesophilobacter sp.]|uniref:GNAT family N-acetyltransferase n=1 Tax=Terrimesophilobacter sp. TaxID=2906435 RepID=UPI002F9539B9